MMGSAGAGAEIFSAAVRPVRVRAAPSNVAVVAYMVIRLLRRRAQQAAVLHG